MFNPKTTKQEPTQVEQVVAETVQGLRQLEGLLGYEFSETVDTIERLYTLQNQPVYKLDDGTVLESPDELRTGEELEARAEAAYARVSS